MEINKNISINRAAPLPSKGSLEVGAALLWALCSHGSAAELGNPELPAHFQVGLGSGKILQEEQTHCQWNSSCLHAANSSAVVVCPAHSLGWEFLLHALLTLGWEFSLCPALSLDFEFILKEGIPSQEFQGAQDNG